MAGAGGIVYTVVEIMVPTRRWIVRLALLVMPFLWTGERTRAAEALPPVRAELGEAYGWTDDDLLVVGTGTVERRWRWTGKGLLTTGFRHLPSEAVRIRREVLLPAPRKRAPCGTWSLAIL
jgi:hypothetical protein